MSWLRPHTIPLLSFVGPALLLALICTSCGRRELLQERPAEQAPERMEPFEPPAEAQDEPRVEWRVRVRVMAEGLPIGWARHVMIVLLGPDAPNDEGVSALTLAVPDDLSVGSEYDLVFLSDPPNRHVSGFTSQGRDWELIGIDGHAPPSLRMRNERENERAGAH